MSEVWQGYIQNKRWTVTLSVRERQASGCPDVMLHDAIAAFLPGGEGMGVKSVLLPPQQDADAAIRHGRQCLLNMGFDPL